MRVVIFIIYSRDSPSKEKRTDGAISKFVRLVKSYCPNVENLIFERNLSEDNSLPFEDISLDFQNTSHHNCVRLNGMCTEGIKVSFVPQI